MNPAKRAFDLFSSIGLLIVLSPLILVVALAILVLDGRPIFFVSERMKSVHQGFWLIRFRTMKLDGDDLAATGGYKRHRVTRLGRILRRTRIDEIPEVLNVIKGDMSLVGPRPPLRRYVELYPDTYDQVLTCRPGVTGLASIYFHAHEAYLLRNTGDPEANIAMQASWSWRSRGNRSTEDMLR